MDAWKIRRDMLAFAAVAMLLLFTACTSQTPETPATRSPVTDTGSPSPNNEKDPKESPSVKPNKPEDDSTLRLPQMDCSTARIPITNAIFDLFTGEYGYEGPEPLSSRTHGAWLNLADGNADIIFLVAPTEDELSYFAEKNVDIEMKVYGYDGLVFIGNDSNPVNNLTPGQIRNIYSGSVSNWQSLGGENSDIIVYIRNPESGSQRLFEDLVWSGYDMPDFNRLGFLETEIDPTVTQRRVRITEYTGMEEITRSVLLNQFAIGFSIMSYIDHTFGDTTLKLFSINGFAPTTENFTSGAYPFLTTSYVAIRADEPADSPARRLFNWVGTDESYDLISGNSTLTVAFSDPITIKAGEGFSTPSVGNSSNTQDSLSETIQRLDQEYISREDLLHFTLEELGYLRNGVYALSGKIFTRDIYIRYFTAQSWYSGTIADDNEVVQSFNEYQRRNLSVISSRERELS